MQFLIKNLLSAVMILAGILIVSVWEQTIPDQTELKQVSGKVISIETLNGRNNGTAIGLVGVNGLFIFYYRHACKANEGRGEIELLLGQNVSIEYSAEIRRRYFKKNVVNSIYSLVSNTGYACTYRYINAENKSNNNSAQALGIIFIIFGVVSFFRKTKA